MEEAPVFSHDGIADGQTETGRGRFRREVGIEDFWRYLLRYTAATIGDRDFHVVARAQKCLRLGLDFYILRRNANDTAVRHGFPRVDHERVDHLFYLAGIDVRFPKLMWNLELGAQIR